MINECHIRNDVEGRGNGFILGIGLIFVWKGLRKTKISVGIAGLGAKIGTHYFLNMKQDFWPLDFDT